MTAANAKTALKAARAALEAKDFDEATSHARQALAVDAANYFAHVFLGRALEKQGKSQEAASAYYSATKLKPDDETAWKGLCSLFESSKDVSGLSEVSMRLAILYARTEDLHQSQSIIDRAVGFAREHGTRQQVKQAMGFLLPSSPIFDLLKGRIQDPALTYRRLAELTEAEDQERISSDIGERRLRLGAKLSQVTTEVGREVYNQSAFEEHCQGVIDWTHDDEERLEFEEKLLQRAFEHLSALLGEAKAVKRLQVIELAHGMVILKRESSLAWHIELEWQDVRDDQESSRDILMEYCRLFPASGLRAAIEGAIGFTNNPIDLPDGDESRRTSEPNAQRRLSMEERLVCFAEGPRASKGSPFAFRLASNFYLQIGEHEAAVEAARESVALLREQILVSGLHLKDLLDATNLTLATALIYYQAPKNHPEAMKLFDGILSRRPESSDALLGIGLIYEERYEFAQAASFLGRANAFNNSDIVISAETAWCRFLSGDAAGGLTQLQDSLSKMDLKKDTPPDLRAKTLYRVGKCLWEIKGDKASRKDRKGPYAYFISSLKTNAAFAPSYTALGTYYADYAKDKIRAQQCFQKAFELSAAELFAAERLAQHFANLADWDIVEVIANRAIQSGVARPPPGSKRGAVSWPFSAMGIVQMNRQEYPLAVNSYHTALRISPDDYHSLIGLGEAYLSSGRYNSASRVLEHAQKIASATDHNWFALYLNANVHQELGDLDLAAAEYRRVLRLKPDEIGVSTALLQTLITSAQVLLEKGFFELATKRAQDAIRQAMPMLALNATSVNFWKAVGDASAVLASTDGLGSDAELFERAIQLFNEAPSRELLRALGDIDGIFSESLEPLTKRNDASAQTCWLVASILAQKHAVIAASVDTYAQSIAWYNLGWIEYTASSMFSGPSRCDIFQISSKAATTCFKKAIEAESGNASFWNALGAATTPFSPLAAQHCFVRSLHLDEFNAETWVALGAMYLQQQDYMLAGETFIRAKATDPDCASAWLGEGLLLLLTDDLEAAGSHFRHAMDLCNASDLVLKRHYVAATFDQLSSGRLDPGHLSQSLLALQHIQVRPWDWIGFCQIGGLLKERAHDFKSAEYSLQTAAEHAEHAFESTENPNALVQFSHLKSDLARCQLALGRYDTAIESATTALDLTGGDAVIEEALRSKLRVSAHLTAGLSYHRRGGLREAVAMFRSALDESHSQPDVICYLAQVLWAQDAASERNLAREQLLESLENNPSHLDSMIILAVITLLTEDYETTEAVIDDLGSIRCSTTLEEVQSLLIDDVLISASCIIQGSEANELRRSVMLRPEQPLGWRGLAEASDNDRLALTAQDTATASTDSADAGAAGNILTTSLDMRSIKTSQDAIMLTPWRRGAWDYLAMTLD